MYTDREAMGEICQSNGIVGNPLVKTDQHEERSIFKRKKKIRFFFFFD